MARTNSANASLPTPVTEGLNYADVIELQRSHADAMTVLEDLLTGTRAASDVGVNASVVNTGGRRTVLLQTLSAGCISTIIGRITGRPFTLVWQSSGSIGMADTGVFALNGALAPGVNTTITLVWTGSTFVELGRSVNG